MWMVAKANGKELIDLLDFLPGDRIVCLTLTSSFAPIDASPPPKPLPTEPEKSIETKRRKPKVRTLHSGPDSSSSSLSSEEEEYLYLPSMPKFLVEEIKGVEALQRQIHEIEQERKRQLMEEANAKLFVEMKSKEATKPRPVSKKRPKGDTGAGLKIFFGGISFKDIQDKADKTEKVKESGNTYRELEEGTWSEDKIARTIALRIDNLKVKSDRGLELIS